MTPAQLQMLKDCNDGEPTDYADFLDRRGHNTLAWVNRERVITALIRKGLLNDDLKVTDRGRTYLPVVQP